MPPLSLNRPAAGRLPLETLNNSTRWKIWEPYELDKKHPILAMIKQEREREGDWTSLSRNYCEIIQTRHPVHAFRDEKRFNPR